MTLHLWAHPGCFLWPGGTLLVVSLSHAGAPPALTVLFVAHAQDDFRCPVITCHHVWSHHEVGTRRPGQAKIKDLERAV